MATRVKKAEKKLELTDLKIDVDGNYLIRNEKDALKAVELAGGLSEQIDEIKVQLAPHEANYDHLRKALREYQNTHNLAEIVNGRWKSDLIERTGSMWIWDKVPEDLEGKEEIIPLRTILKKKIRNTAKRAAIIKLITRTTLNPSGIDDAVKQGLLKEDDIAPAYVEFVSTSYVMIKENK